MNTPKLGALLLAGLLTGGYMACKKDAKPTVEENEALVVFPKGTPVGNPVTKMIGPEGGNIAMPDGRITVTVPPGAVQSATSFSIQPVTSTLPLSCDTITYQLLPEHITFAKPVTIRFNYTTDYMDGSNPDLMSIAYQDSAGHWLGREATALDSIHRTLTINSSHFSTWGTYRLFALIIDRNELSEGEKTVLAIQAVVSNKPIKESEFDDMVPLAPPSEYNSQKNVSNWKLHGQGALQPIPDKSSAGYTAPATISKNAKATVEVTLSNLFDKQNPMRPGRSGKMILLKPIKLLAKQFDFYVDGQKTDLTDIRFSSSGANMVIKGRSGQNDLQATVNAVGKGTYHYAFPSGGIPQGKAVIYYGPDSDLRYLCGTIKCAGGMPTPETIVSPGAVNFTNWGNSGQLVSGSFEATLYRFDKSKQDPCAIQTVAVKATFSMKR